MDDSRHLRSATPGREPPRLRCGTFPRRRVDRVAAAEPGLVGSTGRHHRSSAGRAATRPSRVALVARQSGDALHRVALVARRPDAALHGARVWGKGSGTSLHGAPWVWETRVEGGATKGLWPGLAGDWSSDGRHYFFPRWDAAVRRNSLWVIQERSSLPWPRPRPVQLTLGPLDFGGVGASADGRRLYSWGTTLRGELQRVDPKTGKLAPYLGGLSAADVAASADGRWLAWVAYPEGTLWRSRTDGTERLQLTTSPLSVFLPRFSPDGRQIVFVGLGPEESGLSVRLIPVSGGEPETLAPASPPVESWWDPCWSPDGRSIVASSSFPNHPGLFRIDARTRQIAPLRGAERLFHPKCGRQGAILASEASTLAARVYWPERSVVEPVLVNALLAYPNSTRDGRDSRLNLAKK